MSVVFIELETGISWLKQATCRFNLVPLFLLVAWASQVLTHVDLLQALLLILYLFLLHAVLVHRAVRVDSYHRHVRDLLVRVHHRLESLTVTLELLLPRRVQNSHYSCLILVHLVYCFLFCLKQALMSEHPCFCLEINFLHSLHSERIFLKINFLFPEALISLWVRQIVLKLPFIALVAGVRCHLSL